VSRFSNDDVTLVEKCLVKVLAVLYITGLSENFAVLGLLIVDVEHGRWKKGQGRVNPLENPPLIT
tara:strand:- start:655 stop:849 length:195 start_codon:yes stop_codon:yes gene_type:complete